VPAPLRGADLPKPIRIALVVDPARQGVVARVKDRVLKAASALADACYVVDEVEPPSVDLAATIALEMLAVDSAAGVELMTMYPPEIRGVLRALIELAGNPDHM
jgi:amidase